MKKRRREEKKKKKTYSGFIAVRSCDGEGEDGDRHLLWSLNLRHQTDRRTDKIGSYSMTAAG